MLAPDFADFFDEGGRRAVAGEHHVEGVEARGFEAGIEREKVGGRSFCTGEAAVADVVACNKLESMLRVRDVN